MSPLVKPQRKQETERLSPLVHEKLFITLFVKKNKKKIVSIVQYNTYNRLWPQCHFFLLFFFSETLRSLYMAWPLENKNKLSKSCIDPLNIQLCYLKNNFGFNVKKYKNEKVNIYIGQIKYRVMLILRFSS